MVSTCMLRRGQAISEGLRSTHLRHCDRAAHSNAQKRGHAADHGPRGRGARLGAQISARCQQCMHLVRRFEQQQAVEHEALLDGLLKLHV